MPLLFLSTKKEVSVHAKPGLVLWLHPHHHELVFMCMRVNVRRILYTMLKLTVAALAMALAAAAFGEGHARIALNDNRCVTYDAPEEGGISDRIRVWVDGLSSLNAARNVQTLRVLQGSSGSGKATQRAGASSRYWS